MGPVGRLANAVVGVESFALARGFLRAGVAGRDIGTDDVDRSARCGQRDRGGAGGQIADPATDVIGVCGELAGVQNAVVAVLRFGIGDVVAGGAEGVGGLSAASAVLGLGKHEHVLTAAAQPFQLALGALGGGVGDLVKIGGILLAGFAHGRSERAPVIFP